MEIKSTDYLMVRAAVAGAPLLASLGNLESRWLRSRLSQIPLERPVFVAGLARAGTTILLEALAGIPGVATHRYRDFPFVMIPWWWNRYVERFATAHEPVERPHQDRIRITAESPEAFEEPIWQHFFPHLHAAESIHRLSADTRNDDFEGFFRDHLKKILLIRQGNRYLSKGNYNVARIEYLAKLFPDARFVIPVRHPTAHVESLVRQHELFVGYSRDDRRVPDYLAAAGHYEFGPQRVPIALSNDGGQRILAAWQRGDEQTGYAIQWAEVYRFVDELRARGDATSQRILVLRYEDFCAQPQLTFQEVLRHTGLEQPLASQRDLNHITAPVRDSARLSTETQSAIWKETAAVAQKFGYE